MNELENKESRIGIRLPNDLKNEFYKKCKEEYKKPSEKIRELIFNYIKQK